MKKLIEFILSLFRKPKETKPKKYVQLPLPISAGVFNGVVVTRALSLLPAKMDTPQARVMLVAICLQESNLAHRWQVLSGGRKGAARGLAQFERGGGVYGVLNHVASRNYAKSVCHLRGVPATVGAVYEALETDDILAVAFARLLLWTDPKRLPDDMDAAWDLYIRCWRPGKPHKNRWSANYLKAMAVVYE